MASIPFNATVRIAAQVQVSNDFAVVLTDIIQSTTFSALFTSHIRLKIQNSAFVGMQTFVQDNFHGQGRHEEFKSLTADRKGSSRQAISDLHLVFP